MKRENSSLKQPGEVAAISSELVNLYHTCLVNIVICRFIHTSAFVYPELVCYSDYIQRLGISQILQLSLPSYCSSRQFSSFTPNERSFSDSVYFTFNSSFPVQSRPARSPHSRHTRDPVRLPRHPQSLFICIILSGFVSPTSKQRCSFIHLRRNNSCLETIRKNQT